MEKKRIIWVDILKYICIMFVMMSHLETDNQILRSFYLPVYLTGFFFASGYTYFHKEGFGTFFVKKVKGLFVPWLILSIFNIILSQILSFNEHKVLTEELMWNFFQIRGKGDGLWFIAAIFITYIPFYFVIKAYENKKNKASSKWIFFVTILSLALLWDCYKNFMNPELLPWKTVTLPWHTEYICYAMLWMFLGYLFRTAFEEKYEKSVKAVHGCVALILYIALVIAKTMVGDNIFTLKLLLGYLSSVIGIFVLIIICKALKGNKYVLYIGQNTILCFAFHGKIYSVIQTLLKRFMGVTYDRMLSNTFTNAVFQIVFTIVISFILIVPIYIVNRFFPFIVGRKYKKK